MTAVARQDYQSDAHLFLDKVGSRLMAEVSAGDGGRDISTNMKGFRQ